MKYTIINFGTLRVKALEMIMGLSEEVLREVYTIDEEGFMRIGMHGMVVETGDRRIVIDPGCADFLPRRLQEEYGLEMDCPVSEAVKRAGYPAETITDVLFTHLHFDHGSGAFERRPGGIFKTFPAARFVVSQQHLEYAKHPDAKEEGSFFHKLFKFAGEPVPLESWEAEGISFVESSGHTPHMQIPVMQVGDEVVVFISDLAPMKVFRVHPAHSYYDMDHELVIREREAFLKSLPENTRVVYYHEPGTNCTSRL